MGFISRLFGHEKRAITEPQAADFLPGGFSIFGAAGFNDTAIPVTEELALTVSAVWAAVGCICNGFNSLPAHVLNRATGEKQYDHPVAALLGREPNSYMTAATFRDAMMANLLLWGPAYSYIERDEMGRPIALYPLLSRVTRPLRVNGQLLYQTQLANQLVTITPDRMFHVLGLTFDGITALSPIQYARQTIGVSLALERFAAKFFGAGANVGGVLEAPTMSPDAQKDFVEKWRKAYTSIDGMFKIAAMPPGTKFTPTSVDPEKAQAVQSRVHQIREVARIFHVPPHKLADLERATFSNIEHQQVEYQQECIQPWAIKWEQEADRKLFLEREKPTLQLKFNLDALLRADTKTRYDAHNVALQAGVMTVNEVRAKENLPPVPGGDVLRAPLNMAAVAPSPATRGLVEDAARRAITKEIRAIQRAAKKHAGKPDELRAWATTFYATHEATVARTMAAPLAAVGTATTPEAYAKRHCQESIRAITQAIDNKTPIADLLADFEERPEAIADELTKDQ